MKRSRPQLPEGRIIDCRQEGRRLRWVVTDMPDARIGEIGDQLGVESVDVHRPNLEEIFVAHMQGIADVRPGVDSLVSCDADSGFPPGGVVLMKAFSLKGCGRILWHEAAEQSVICLGILAVLVTVQASLATMAAFGVIQTPSVAFGFCMALFMTAMYAAASSAILFTADVDAGTFVFHRTKPIGWLTYLWGKLSWTALSSLALGLAAWIETCVWQSVFPGARDASLALGVSGVGIVEGMAGGLIASMMFRGPLRAVIAG